MAEPLVVIGKGMAATRLVEALSARALGRYAIAVIGEEPRPAYNRVLLSSVLAGEMATEDTELKPAAWWRDRGVTTLYGRAATSIDRVARTVMLSDGTVIPYAKLVLATGSQPIRLPIPGADLPGVVTFRDHRDVAAMQQAAARGARCIVIGGWLLGIEAAYGLQRCGADVTLVHLMDRLMERQLDAPAAAILKGSLEAKGIAVALSAASERILGTARVEGLALADGRQIPADMIVLAAGIRPQTALARAAGIACNRGILVDDGLTTDDPAIFAIGECAEHRGVVHGLVEPAYQQAAVLAARLAGDGAAFYAGSLTATNLKVSGIGVFSAGRVDAQAGDDELVLADGPAGLYRKLVLREDRLVGALLVGDTRDALWFQSLIADRRPVGAMRDLLVFGRAFAAPADDAVAAPLPAAAAPPLSVPLAA